MIGETVTTADTEGKTEDHTAEQRTTLAEALAKDRVNFEELETRYQPVLGLVNTLIGVVPNCDPYLEIWQPGFRTYNLMVPNFLNLPAALVGVGAPKDIVGLGMYASSRAAECAYCSAHTCSFALRRGSSAEAVTGEARTEGEAATVAIAEALSTVPHHYTPDMAEELRRHYSDGDAEWIVMGVAMMGFLNKFMDAVGVELEAESINDVAELIEPTGWSVGQHDWAHEEEIEPEGGVDEVPVDSWRTMIPVLRNAPGAVRLERGWMTGIPKNAAKARQMIVDRYGFDEPVLTDMAHGKPARALTAMLRHNLDVAQSELGIGLKALVGLVFAQAVGNESLASSARALAEAHGVSPERVSAADGFNPMAPADGLDDRSLAALSVARAIAPSPAAVTPQIVEQAEKNLSSAEIVEISVWVSVSQLLHRLRTYFER